MEQFVYDDHHLTHSQQLFPDGKIRSAFPITPLEDIAGRKFLVRDLRHHRLRQGTEYFQDEDKNFYLSPAGVSMLVLGDRASFSDEFGLWFLDTMLTPLTLQF